jgi:hypothetical protein
VAVFVATDYNIKINGQDYSANLTQAELSLEADDVETTAFGSTYRSRIGGLKQGSLNLQFNQDFAAAGIDSVLFPLLGTQATVVIKPNSTAVSATNPSYTFNALVTSYTPISGSVGDLSTFSVTWPVSGAVTRATA